MGNKPSVATNSFKTAASSIDEQSVSTAKLANGPTSAGLPDTEPSITAGTAHTKPKVSLPSSSSAHEHIGGRLRKKLPFYRTKSYDFYELEPHNLRAVNENESLPLTRPQRELLLEGWQTVTRVGSNQPGLFIFKRIFTRNPEVKVVFHLHKVNNSKLEESLRFQKHAQVFTNFLDIIMRSLEKLDDNLGPLLYYYGSKHVAFEKHHSFKPEYWNDFGHALIEYQNTWEVADAKEMRQAWKILVEFIIKKLWEGFELEHERCIQREHEKYT